MEISDALLAAAAPLPRRELLKRLEARAVRLTWDAWRQRHDERLHALPDMDLTTEAAQDLADEMFWGKAVGVLPPEDVIFGLEFLHNYAIAGIWYGIRPGFLGTDLTLGHFAQPWSSTHRCPQWVGFVYVLPAPFQEIARRDRHGDIDDHCEIEDCDLCAELIREDILRYGG